MDRYGNQEEFESDDSGFVCFVSISSSPQVKQGLLPPVMTLIDYNIEYCGNISAINYKLSHITELDLANNLISSWQEVENILTAFKGLIFLQINEQNYPSIINHISACSTKYQLMNWKHTYE